MSPHVVNKLARDLSQGLSGQGDRIGVELPERHKLDDVGRHLLHVLLAVEWLVISIEHVHGVEIRRANTHDDDAQSHGGASNYLIDGLWHVADDAIGDNKQNVILLIVLADFERLGIGDN